MGASAHAAPPATLIVTEPAEWRSRIAADGLTELFTDRGFTVDVVSALPADLTPYCCAWDLRPSVALSAADAGAWADFLALGRGLVMVGESESCCAARNRALIDLVNGPLGGGPASVGARDPSDIEEQATPGLEVTTTPYRVERVHYSFVTNIADPGRGEMVTRDGSRSQVLALWDRGDLAAAPDGRLAIALDIEWIAQFRLQRDNHGLIANLAELMCPATGHGVVVEMTDPLPGLPLTVECESEFEISGFVVGNTRGGSCVGGPAPPTAPVAIAAIEVSIDGGPFVAVSSSTPALPSLPPVEFTASGLYFAQPLGPHVAEVRAVDELGNAGQATVPGNLEDTRAPVPPPGWCSNVRLPLDDRCEAVLPPPPPAIDACDPTIHTTIVPPHPLHFAGPGFVRTFYGWRDDLLHGSSCARTVYAIDDAAPTIDCAKPLALECEGRHGVARDTPAVQAWLATTTATDNCSRATLAQDAPAEFPWGCPPGAATEVTWSSSDEAGNTGTCRSSLTVVDSEPPVLGAVRFDGTCLWPPNHRLWCVEDVAAEVESSDLCDPDAPEVVVLGCRSSAPEDGTGDGRFAPDCVILDAGRGLCVRAERDGGSPDGRVYTVEIGARDRCGNLARREVRIRVPHDPGDAGRPCVRPGEAR